MNKAAFFSRIFQAHLLLAFCLLSMHNVHSQPIFSTGKVITAQGDTLQGWLGESGGFRNYSKCMFRSGKNAKQQVFQPGEIRGYLIEDRRYFESRKMPQPSGDSTLVFAEYIVRGGISLLQVRKEYFLLDEQGALQRVPFSYNYRYANFTEADLSRLRNEWLRFLHNISLDCPAMSDFFEEAKNLEYEEDNLIHIVRVYNACKGKQYIEYGGDLPFAVFDVGPGASINRTNIPFVADQPQEFQYLTVSDFNLVGMEWSMPVYLRSTRRLTNFGFYMEPFVRFYQLQRNLEYNFQSNPHTAYYSFSSEWLSVGTPFAFRYTVPNITPYLSVQIGPRLDFLFKRQAELIVEAISTENNFDYITSNFLRPFELADSQIGFSVQVNVTNVWLPLAGRWEVSLGANFGAGITDFDDSTVSAGLPLATQTRTIFLKTAFLW